MKKILVAFFIACFFKLLITGNVFAQADVHNTGVLYVTTGTNVYVENSFTNTGTAALTNNGMLFVKQHISNNQAGMVAGTGSLLLNGTATQNVNGSQPFSTYNLITDNNAGFMLNNDLSVANLHTYTNGIITTAATPNYLVYQAGASYTGSNDNNHVNGWIKKLGNTDFTFPVGNGTYERPLTLSSIASASEFAVKHQPALTPNYTSLYGTLVLVDTSEYWTINRISGTSAVVTMTWDHSKIPVPQVLLSAVQAAYYDGSLWRSFGNAASGDVATTGSVTSNSTTVFNTNFTIGSTALVLPLQLISFTGQRNNIYNEIKWHIANETGIISYSLQRSDDAVNFYTIATKAAINNNGNSSYIHNDAAFTATKTYYRLKYTDANGVVKYSAVISVAADPAADKNFYVIQNPVTSKIDFYASPFYKGAYVYTLTAASGKLVQSGTVNITAGGVYSLPFHSLAASGVYVLTLQSAQQRLRKTILKQ